MHVSQTEISSHRIYSLTSPANPSPSAVRDADQREAAAGAVVQVKLAYVTARDAYVRHQHEAAVREMALAMSESQPSADSAHGQSSA